MDAEWDFTACHAQVEVPGTVSPQGVSRQTSVFASCSFSSHDHVRQILGAPVLTFLYKRATADFALVLETHEALSEIHTLHTHTNT